MKLWFNQVKSKNIMKENTHGGGSAAGRRVSAVLGPCDVLLGRGTGPNENQGNKMFRDILKKHKEAYRTAETKREKRDIVMTAIGEFKAVGGRFLEKVVVPAQQQSSSNKHCYEVVDGPAVCLKARQAFRYLLRGVEIDDDHKEEQNTPSTPTSMLGVDLPSAPRRHRLLPTIHSSAVKPNCEASSLSMNAMIIPSQVENGNMGDLTSRDDAIGIHRLASLVSEEAPMLASSLGNTSHYCPTTIPLSFLRLRQIMSDTGTSPSNPEMLLNAIRFLENWAWAKTDHANTHGIPGFVTNEIIGHRGQYPTISDISQIATRAQRLDSLLKDLLGSQTTTTDSSLIFSQYRRNLSEGQSKQEVEQSRIASIEQQGVIARALIEHRLHENHRLTALVIPDLQRIMMNNSKKDASLGNPFRRNLEESHDQPRHGGETTLLHQIMTGLPGDSGFVFSK